MYASERLDVLHPFGSAGYFSVLSKLKTIVQQLLSTRATWRKLWAAHEYSWNIELQTSRDDRVSPGQSLRHDNLSAIIRIQFPCLMPSQVLLKRVTHHNINSIFDIKTLHFTKVLSSVLWLSHLPARQRLSTRRRSGLVRSVCVPVVCMEILHRWSNLRTSLGLCE